MIERRVGVLQPGRRHIFVGDVHGCVAELEELLSMVSARPDDCVVLLGDLVDRGPDPAAVVRVARERGMLAVVGNHEDKLLRHRAHQTTGHQPNPVLVEPKRLAQWHQLSEDDWRWLEQQPYLRTGFLGDRLWVAVHGGLEPGKDLGKQDLKVLPFVRGVSAEGLWGRGAQPLHRWAELWRGPARVAYGHQIFPEVQRDRDGEASACYGLDTGCCFGGSLSALVVREDGEVDHVAVVPSRQPKVERPRERACRACGCTDSDCALCIERTGAPCFWVEADLCSVCYMGA